MSSPRRVLLAGATGLVGAQVLDRLLAEPEGPWVLAPVRRPLAIESRRLTPFVADLADPAQDAALADRLRAATPVLDAFICALGTTIRRAGNREAFLAVDRELVLRLAAIAHGLGARQAILVSSVGASAQSGNFYLRVKGETERAISALGFERVDLLRPGLLLGDREESRPGESIAKVLTPLTNPLLRGPLQRYRGIAADDVAAAAVALLDQAGPGRFVHENAGLLALARA
ncbi:NAD(P)H-binding protein [Arenimonas daejeonensis]|uniref:NAD(P)H-binding protein n=1 Tax=Arenimonas daejeonensis TaxID=370777 RepID=UPI001D13A712|nr:NAD(P)H-binding protein [Arenimonas daejeonensis]